VRPVTRSVICTPIKESILIKVVLIISIFLSSSIQAEELNSTERMKRKIVSRMYQATEGALARCPEKDIKTFEKSLTKFNESYPEFVSLLKVSSYRKYAVDNFSDDIQRSKIEPIEKLSQECLYIKSLIDSMLTTESGKKSVEAMLASLKQ
jgi:hypothetical protein